MNHPLSNEAPLDQEVSLSNEAPLDKEVSLDNEATLDKAAPLAEASLESQNFS
jgi:hypothetical protein